MLPKSKRLSKSEIPPILKQGRTVSEARFRLKYIPAKEPAFAVVVSKKVARNAPARNSARRRVYSALREDLPRLSQPVQALLFVQQDILSVPYAEITAEISRLLGKIPKKKAGKLEK